MAILEKEVWISINNRNITHFRQKGYVLKGRTNILVKTDELSLGSGILVTKVCDDCGNKVENLEYGAIISQRGKFGKDLCKNCAVKYGGKNRKKNMPYEKSLEYWAIKNNKESLLKDYSLKNSKTPSEISRATSDVYLWECSNGHEYEMAVSLKSSAELGCPFCSNRRVDSTNSLWTTHPEIAKLLRYSERGHEITRGANRKETFVCENCGYANDKIVNEVTSNGFYCKRCDDKLSYPEKFMTAMLLQISNINFETQKLFNWSKNTPSKSGKTNGNKVYDFYISGFGGVIIETHGRQHYEDCLRHLGGRTLLEEQANDEFKRTLALDSGEIKHYITINCSQSNMTYIQNSILNSELSTLLDLSTVDFKKCDEFAQSSMIKVVSDYWNSGIRSTPQIGNIIKRHSSTVSRYLKHATELGWCDYDPQVEKMKFLQFNGHNKKKVVQLTLDGEFIKVWEGAVDIEKQLNIRNKQISKVCNGKAKTAGGFKWMFLVNYINN